MPLCPDFVIELMSPSDDDDEAQAKMREYVANGASLGWLIDIDRHEVRAYRAGGVVEVIEAARTLRGDPVLPGFVLDLGSIG